MIEECLMEQFNNKILKRNIDNNTTQITITFTHLKQQTLRQLPLCKPIDTLYLVKWKDLPYS